MLFNTIEYLLFLPVVLLLYYFLPVRAGWVVLTLASVVFFGFHSPERVFLLLSLIIIGYFFGIELERFRNEKTSRRIVLFVAVALFLIPFGLIRFGRQIIDFILGLTASSGPAEDILVPLGFSFLLLQTISYLVAVSRNEIRAEKHLGYFALFLSFFPKVFAGPLEKPGSLLLQFRSLIHASRDSVYSGVSLVLYGLILKMVIADNIAPFVDLGFDQPADASQGAGIVSVLLFPFQLYADLQGYALIAIGSAQMFGIRLSPNFNRPFMANSIRDYIGRWHITFHQWFREMLFDTSKGWKVWKFPATWLAAGLAFLAIAWWHGPSFKYLIWAGIPAFFLWLEQTNRKGSNRVSEKKWRPGEWLGIVKTFVVMTIAWMFFRVDSVQDGFVLLKSLFFGNHSSGTGGPLTLGWIPYLLVFFLMEWLYMRYPVEKKILKLPGFLRWVVFGAAVGCLGLFASLKGLDFIYTTF